jgi:hypothetical protein
MTWEMMTEEALETAMDIASRWGENAEERFTSRLQPDMTDEQVEEIVRMPDGEVDKFDLEDAVTIRNLWRALDVLGRVRGQKDCEHFDPACTDGKLTTLCDVVVFR